MITAFEARAKMTTLLNNDRDKVLSQVTKWFRQRVKSSVKQNLNEVIISGREADMLINEYACPPSLWVPFLKNLGYVVSENQIETVTYYVITW